MAEVPWTPHPAQLTKSLRWPTPSQQKGACASAPFLQPGRKARPRLWVQAVASVPMGWGSVPAPHSSHHPSNTQWGVRQG